MMNVVYDAKLHFDNMVIWIWLFCQDKPCFRVIDFLCLKLPSQYVLKHYSACMYTLHMCLILYDNLHF